jgi:hypothetical protein
MKLVVDVLAVSWLRLSSMSTKSRKIMTKERDIFISPQQWAAAKNIEMTPEVKSAVFLL